MNWSLTNDTDVAIHFWSYENFARDLQEQRFLSYLLGVDVDPVFQNLTGSHIVLSAGLCGPYLLHTYFLAKNFIITDNLEISNVRWVVLTILTPLETNDITVDLNVLPKAIIDRKYFMGQVPVSCFLRKMFRVINVIYFFYHQIVQVEKKWK